MTLWSISFAVTGEAAPTTTELRVSDVALSNAQIPPQSIPTSGAGTSVSVTAGVCGDLTGDGDVNVFDAIILLQVAVGLIQPTPLQQQLGGLNRDGNINVFDAITTLPIIVGLINVSECGPTA